MVAPLVAAAAIGAAGSVIGGITGGKGAKKAAQIQAQSTQAQIAAANANRDYQYQLNAPTIGYGNAADDRIAGLLNIGGDPAASAAAYGAYKDSTGYTSRLMEGQNSINSNAYAGGLGRSGATLKALTRFGQDYATRDFGNYVNMLGGVSANGASARGLVAGVGQNTVNQFAQSNQAGADAAGNAAIIQANNNASAVQGLFNAGAYALGSSYNRNNSNTPGYGGSTGYQTPYGVLPFGLDRRFG